MHDDGARKARWTRGYEQTLNGNEDFFSATPMMNLKNDVGRGSLAMARGGTRRLQRGLLPVTCEPRRNRKPGLDRAACRGRAGARLHVGSRVSFPSLKGAPRVWDPYSANVLTSTTEMEQSRCDGCLFYHFEPRREHMEEKAGRHIDDFLVTGLERNVERFLKQARDKLNMQDAVRLCKTGDEGRLLAINIRKLGSGYSLQGAPLLIHGIATALGMENAPAYSPVVSQLVTKSAPLDSECLEERIEILPRTEARR